MVERGRCGRGATLFLTALGAVLGGVLLVRALLVDTVVVGSDSMAPTLCAGDWLLVSKLRPGAAADVGDVVVYRSPDGDLGIKRVVAVGGQELEIYDAVVSVDGQVRAEPYVDHESVDGTFFGPVTVPPGTLFLMGDGREVSIDSRDHGAVPRDAVEGVVWTSLRSTCEIPSPSP